jgi:hypothetical protein
VQSVIPIAIGIHFALYICLVALRRLGIVIVIEINKPMRYGFVIKFYYLGIANWMMVYKNRKNRTNFCFPFISITGVANYLSDNENFDEIAQGS